MSFPDNRKLSVLSIPAPTSARQIRTLTPSEPVGELHLSPDRVLDAKRAEALVEWPPVTTVSVYAPTTKAALRRLLSLPGLEALYLSDLCQHGSLSQAPRPASLRTFRCDWLHSKDLLQLSTLLDPESFASHYANLSEPFVKNLLNLSNLKHLDLEGSNLDDGLVELLATSRQIERLYLGATRIGPAGLQNICTMEQLTELDTWALKLEECDLECLTALSKLEYLSLGGYEGQSGLTAQGVLPLLERLPVLKSLWLDGIALSVAEIEMLKQRYEHVQVT